MRLVTTMRDPVLCKWHQCDVTFTPNHGAQKYCCPAHAIAMINWRKMRGVKVVAALIETPLKDLDAVMRGIRRDLINEIQEERKNPEK